MQCFSFAFQYHEKTDLAFFEMMQKYNAKLDLSTFLNSKSLTFIQLFCYIISVTHIVRSESVVPGMESLQINQESRHQSRRQTKQFIQGVL